MAKTSQSHVILAGDIGGTKTSLGIFRFARVNSRLIREKSYASRDYEGLEVIFDDFNRNQERISAASFGVAGPIVNGVAIATNLPWKITESKLKKLLKLDNVQLVNDLVANAYGIEVLRNDEFAILNRGKKSIGNRAVLSAGTGLGAAMMFWDGKHYLPFASEGGHVDFGPQDDLELDLLRYLFKRYRRVSYERVLSGAGLLNIYQFLRESEAFGKEARWLRETIETNDPASVISEAARLRRSKLCGAALDLFVSIYGSAAGNLALQTMATGGMYIGGGIAPKIIWKLKDGTFMKAFKNRGRLSPIIDRIPVKVIMNEQAALLGAAWHAYQGLKTRKISSV